MLLTQSEIRHMISTVPGFTERLPKGPETETAASLQGDDKLNALIRRAAGLKGSGGEKQALQRWEAVRKTGSGCG